MRSAACIAIQDLEASIMQNMLKEMCGTVLHVFNWKRAQNSHMRAYITSSRMRKGVMLIPYPGVDTKSKIKRNLEKNEFCNSNTEVWILARMFSTATRRLQ